MDISNQLPTAISGITDPKKIRVLVYSNNQLVHVPLTAITDPIKQRIDALRDALKAANPAGEIKYFAGNTVPEGWLHCNGAEVSRAVYARLFNTVGTTYGAGDSLTTFNLPDLRGEFIRGFDDDRGVDPGRMFGTRQGDAIRNIIGQVKIAGGQGGMDGGQGAFTTNHFSTYPGSWGGNLNSGIAFFNAANVVPTANENRPRNVAVLICIKF